MTESANYAGDTWTFDNIDWTEQQSQYSPSPRAYASMVNDPERQRAYLFGGSYSVEKLYWLYNDTWAWDGTNWLQLFPQHQPAERTHAAVAFDPIRNYTLLYGGGSYATTLTDTWTWDGTDWTEKTTEHSPNHLYYPQMAFDPSRQQMVLVGMQFPSQAKNGTETWVWTGEDWLQLPITHPLPYELMPNGKLIYFPVLKTVALVNTFTQKVVSSDGNNTFINRSEVWALVERYLSYYPLVSR